MKRFTAAVMLLMLALGTAVTARAAYSCFDSYRNNYSFEVNGDGTARLTYCRPDNDRNSVIRLPETLTYDGIVYPVTGLAPSFGLWIFSNADRLYIPDSIRLDPDEHYSLSDSIGAFEVSDTHPTLETIDGVLFYKPDNVLLSYPEKRQGDSYDIPDGTAAVAWRAFDGTNGLKAIRVPDSVRSFGEGAFPIEGFENIVLSPDHPTLVLEGGILYNRADRALITALKGVKRCAVPKGIEKIGYSAFFYHGDFETVTVPETVKTIGDSAFEKTDLKTAVLSEGLERIGDYAFANTRLTGITLPETLTEIGEGAFKDCFKYQTQIRIPANVQKIGEGAFDGTVQLLVEKGSPAEALCAGYGWNYIVSDAKSAIEEIPGELRPSGEIPDWLLRPVATPEPVREAAEDAGEERQPTGGTVDWLRGPEPTPEPTAEPAEETAEDAGEEQPAGGMMDWLLKLMATPVPKPLETAVPATAAPEGWHCPKCGRLNYYNFCSNCGAPRPAAEPSPTATLVPTVQPIVTAIPVPTKTPVPVTERPLVTLAPQPAGTAEPAENGLERKASKRFDVLTALDAFGTRGATEYTLRLSPELYADVKDSIGDRNSWFSEARANSAIVTFSYYLNDRENTLKLTDIEYRVAHRLLLVHRGVLPADQLTQREKQALEEAQRIVRAAPKDELACERYLHDTICQRVTYYTNDNSYEEKDQAVGALLNGKADCDGYSETFYLLCNMADIPARFQHGDTYEKDAEHPNATHMWNLIRVKGPWLMTDVTWDDMDDAGSQAYLYYNINTERAAETHFWNQDAVLVRLETQADSNKFRPADIAEARAASLAEAEAAIRGAFIDRHADRIAVVYAEGLPLGKDDKENLSRMIFAAGIKEYRCKFGKHAVEIIPTERYTDCWFVASESEAIATVRELKNAGKRSFTLFYAGDFGKALFADDFAKMYQLEGQYGFVTAQTSYSADGFSCTYSQLDFADNFRVCASEKEIVDYVGSLAAKGVKQFSLCVPGKYGSGLFANSAEGLNAVLEKSLLKLNPTYRYSIERQTAHFREAAYWPKADVYSLRTLESAVRARLKGQPDAVAFWTDGSFQWNSQNYEELKTAFARSGVEAYLPRVKPGRVEISDIRYASNYALADSEDELVSFVKACKAKKLASFQIYCSQELYKSMSAKNFARFNKLTKSILKSKSIYFSDTTGRIVIEDAKYTK